MNNDYSVPTRPILRSLVSSNRTDVFRCYSDHERTYVNLPYACSYSNASKRGGKPLLAVCTEQGTVDILDTSKREQWDVEPQRTTVQPHANGVFDVKWSPSDTLLATASGDHSVCITTLSSSVAPQDRILHTLRGHTGTVKSVAWDPSHDGDVLCSGGRDGWICLWDLRVGERSDAGVIAPVLSIPKAHELDSKPAKPKARRGRVVAGAPPASITHLLYTDTHPYGVISSCSSDGILNLWDVRLPSSNTRSRSKKAAKQRPMPLFTSPDPTTYGGTRRARGITTLASGTGPTAALVFGLGSDSRVHTYALPSLAPLSGLLTFPSTPGDAEAAEDPHAFFHPRMKTTSFYVRMATSPCGRWLAAGGIAEGRAYLYDIAAAGRARDAGRGWWGSGVELRGHTGEVGAMDWADGMLATCGDDGTVRVWRPDLDISRQCEADPEEMQWNWAWATDS
ncbi:WD40 repeat-like protein [Trametes coccinea BRFM310]|uniref:WD40 repeat-like protein n=1 Tax=Trametes coccinea (strain BRFM310) TaxID=1353009 RepID=A0A1Y2IE00_TRAC3|nr:WD40 repeat-like protein [Trametes coccinea BRFM310]